LTGEVEGFGLLGIYLPHFQNHGAKSASDVSGSIADFAHRRPRTFPGGSAVTDLRHERDLRPARESICEVLEPHACDVDRRELSVTVRSGP